MHIVQVALDRAIRVVFYNIYIFPYIVIYNKIKWKLLRSLIKLVGFTVAVIKMVGKLCKCKYLV